MQLQEGSWVQESLVDGWRQQIQVKKVLMPPQRSKFQDIAAFESESLGTVMVIDDRIQLTTADDFAYHEMFVHVPIIAHGDVKNVLIIGGGDGATLREVVKHKGVKVTLVDIDEKIIECSKNFFPTLHEGAWENPLVTVIVGDGVKFVHETSDKFEVIIIDSTDPEETGPSNVLYQEAFYQDCKRILSSPKGVVITQNGHPQFESYPKIALSHLAAVFKHTTVYQFCVPTYLGGIQAFGWGTDDPASLTVSVEELEKRWAATGIQNVKHYTPEYHKSTFVLPKWLKEQVQESLALAQQSKKQ